MRHSKAPELWRAQLRSSCEPFALASGINGMPLDLGNSLIQLLPVSLGVIKDLLSQQEMLALAIVNRF